MRERVSRYTPLAQRKAAESTYNPSLEGLLCDTALKIEKELPAWSLVPGSHIHLFLWFLIQAHQTEVLICNTCCNSPTPICYSPECLMFTKNTTIYLPSLTQPCKPSSSHDDITPNSLTSIPLRYSHSVLQHRHLSTSKDLFLVFCSCSDPSALFTKLLK